MVFKVQLPMAGRSLLVAANQGIVLVLAMVVVGGLVAGSVGAAAAVDISLDFTAAAPLTYDHSTGGGHWSDGKSSLTPFSLAWTCGDIVSYVLRLDVRNDAATTAAKVSIDMTSDATGQSGIALVPVANGATIDGTEPAQAGNANSAITDFAATTSGTPLSSGATSSVGFTVRLLVLLTFAKIGTVKVRAVWPSAKASVPLVAV